MNGNKTTFDPAELIAELDAGTLGSALGAAIKEAALGTLHHGESTKKGKITLTLELVKIPKSQQVHINHRVEYKAPKAKGFATEQRNEQSTVYVLNDGTITLLPPDQHDWVERAMKNKEDGKHD